MCDACKWLIVIAMFLAVEQLPAQQPIRLDPAAWGSDHVGKPVPAFTSGDECLFCHRMDIGPTWSINRHGQTIRIANAEPDALKALANLPQAKNLAAEVELLLGRSNRIRFLKRSAHHGRLDLLFTEWTPGKAGSEGKLVSAELSHWDTKTFGARCAGCHATGVDSTKQTFAAISLDCFVCHGEPTEKHTTEGRLVFLSRKRNDSPVVITSICAQCHLRTGMSKSTGLPYPNHFVAGDNLFRDYQVDLSNAALQKLNPADRHVQENVRDVVLLGREDITCLSCHDIHKQSTEKHQAIADSHICQNCHGSGPRKNRIRYEVHSAKCGY